MHCDECDNALTVEIRGLVAALVDQSRALEALALACVRQGRQGTLRIKIDAPPAKVRRKVRRRRPAGTAEGGAR